MHLYILVVALGVVGANMSGHHPSSGDCLCVTGSGVNARNHAGLSGSVVGSVSQPSCYTFNGGISTRDGHTWFELQHVHGQTAWVAGGYLSTATHSHCIHHSSSSTPCTDSTAKDYACKILALHNSNDITLAKVHPSGVHDNAYTYNNIRDACAGHAAIRSHYTCSECHSPGAPGGHVCLNRNLLLYIYTMATTVPHLKVNEIAGACHSCHSIHYLGRAVDLHNGAGSSTMLTKCESMGGWKLDEGDHIHCQFPS